MRRVMRHRDLRLLFTAYGLSAAGSWGYNIALLAWVFERTGSLTWVGAAGLARFLPSLVTSAYAGVVAERFERVRLLALCDAVAAASQVALVVVALLDGPVIIALILSATTAVAIAPYESALAALVPQVAGEEEIVAANAVRASLDNLVVIVGPAIGALLLAFWPAEVVFALDAATYVVSAVLISRLSTRSTPSDVTEGGEAGPMRQIAEGFRALRRSRTAVPLVALSALASFVYGTDTVLLVGAADERLGMGPDGFGLLMAAMGAGGIAMATVVNRLAAITRLTWLLLAGIAAYTLPNLLVALTESAVAGTSAQVIRGAGTLVVDVLAITALQRAVAPEMIARVFGIFFAIVLGSISLGTVVAPVLISATDLATAVGVVAVAPLALSLLMMRALLSADRIAVTRQAAIAPRVAVLARLGMLDGAPRAVLEQLAASASTRVEPPGTVIVAEGDPAEQFYVLVEGEVDVSARGEAGHPRFIRTQVPGSWFGEIGLLGHVPRTATVTTRTQALLLEIDGDAFLRALTTTPPSTAFIDNARARLAHTHPTQRLAFETP